MEKEDPPSSGSEGDLPKISELLSTSNWELQLAVARAKREKVLAQRAKSNPGKRQPQPKPWEVSEAAADAASKQPRRNANVPTGPNSISRQGVTSKNADESEMITIVAAVKTLRDAQAKTRVAKEAQEVEQAPLLSQKPEHGVFGMPIHPAPLETAPAQQRNSRQVYLAAALVVFGIGAGVAAFATLRNSTPEILSDIAAAPELPRPVTGGDTQDAPLALTRSENATPKAEDGGDASQVNAALAVPLGAPETPFLTTPQEDSGLQLALADRPFALPFDQRTPVAPPPVGPHDQNWVAGFSGGDTVGLASLPLDLVYQPDVFAPVLAGINLPASRTGPLRHSAVQRLQSSADLLRVTPPTVLPQGLAVGTTVRPVNIEFVAWSEPAPQAPGTWDTELRRPDAGGRVLQEAQQRVAPAVNWNTPRLIEALTIAPSGLRNELDEEQRAFRIAAFSTAPLQNIAIAQPELALPDSSIGPQEPPFESNGRSDLFRTDRVTIQIHAPTSVPEKDVRDLTTKLKNMGLPLRPVSRVSFRISSSNVRFFHAEDSSAAQALAETVGATVRDFTDYTPSPPDGTIEVWLASASDGSIAPAAKPARIARPKPSVKQRQVRQGPTAKQRQLQSIGNRIIQRLRRGDHL